MQAQIEMATIERFGTGRDKHGEARRIAAKLFDRAYGQGRRGQWWAKLRGKSNQLKPLTDRPLAAVQTTGTVLVPLNQIVGTENRSGDFDQSFRPLRMHLREKWIGIAAARRTGVILPVVELIQAPNGYYVRDGHHRISVAMALGQLEIEAHVVN
jgi:hypothetical protein